MLRSARLVHQWRLLTIGSLLVFWLCVTAMFVLATGNVEGYLKSNLGIYSYADAFHDLNRSLLVFWVTHSLLTFTAVVANWLQRTDVLIVLLIGPAMAVAIAMLQQQWTDPEWAVVVGIGSIGWSVSLFIGWIFWIAKRRSIVA